MLAVQVKETKEPLELGLLMEEGSVWVRKVGKDILVVVNRKLSIILNDDSDGLLSFQVFMEIHTRKSASLQNDWEEQLCGAL